MLLEHEPCSSLMHVNFYQRTEIIQRATQYFYFSNFIFSHLHLLHLDHPDLF